LLSFARRERGGERLGSHVTGGGKGRGKREEKDPNSGVKREAV